MFKKLHKWSVPQKNHKQLESPIRYDSEREINIGFKRNIHLCICHTCPDRRGRKDRSRTRSTSPSRTPGSRTRTRSRPSSCQGERFEGWLSYCNIQGSQNSPSVLFPPCSLVLVMPPPTLNVVFIDISYFGIHVCVHWMGNKYDVAMLFLILIWSITLVYIRFVRRGCKRNCRNGKEVERVKVNT